MSSPRPARQTRERSLLSSAPERLPRSLLGEQSKEQQNTTEAQITAVGLIPFAGRVRAAPNAARTDRDGRQTHRERHIGIGRGAVDAGTDMQIVIDGLYGFQKRGVRGEFAARTRTQFFDMRREPPASGRTLLAFDAALHRSTQQGRKLIEHRRVFRAQVEFGARSGRNGIDAGPAFDNAEIVRGPDLAFRAESRFSGLRELADQFAERMYGIGRAVVIPTMPAWAREGDFKAPARERLSCNVFGRRAVEHDERADVFALPGQTVQTKITHAAEVALAFLADVSDQHDARGKRVEAMVFTQQPRERQQRREACAVVRNAGADQPAIRCEINVFGATGRENGIEI